MDGTDSGTYVVEAAGAMGGRNPNANGDFGYAYARGKFNLSVGDKLKILVGQMGLNSTSNNSGGLVGLSSQLIQIFL